MRKFLKPQLIFPIVTILGVCVAILIAVHRIGQNSVSLPPVPSLENLVSGVKSGATDAAQPARPNAQPARSEQIPNPTPDNCNDSKKRVTDLEEQLAFIKKRNTELEGWLEVYKGWYEQFPKQAVEATKPNQTGDTKKPAQVGR